MHKILCLLCKVAVDEDDTYKEYRETKEYKEGVYPEWAYTENLLDHYINFHRLPIKLAVAMITMEALLKETLADMKLGDNFTLYIA